MSEQILKALMELFAVIARPEGNRMEGDDRRTVVESYLQRILNQELVDGYLNIFDNYYTRHQSLVNTRGVKRIGPDSVKILRICDQINRELTQKQKLIVLIHLFEFVNSVNTSISAQEFEFIQTVGESFNIDSEEHDLICKFTINKLGAAPSSSKILLVNNNANFVNHGTKHLYSNHFKGELWLLQAASSNLYFLRYQGDNELYLNGQLLQPDKVFVFTAGSSIRNHTIKPLYYSDIVTLFLEEERESKIHFDVKDISFRFKSGTMGLQTMSFTKESGRLVGIMGASGAGKSTLLNVLNGTENPTTGSITINGRNIYNQKERIDGLIGHVSQDDLLIEELTVFQNLYYNAKLCFSNYKQEKIISTVDQMLQSLGLYEIKDIQVGTPLNKMISGGQRKRLNIALELIREPAVLFLDEPTSGLSSRDSENIMDLLKELTLKGKLVFVVIHQPSSEIFKMFDELLILDTGGYLIYDGDPIDSIVYFKSKIDYANYNESECHECGNVNPEQIFNIVESNILDEYGKFTHRRKISPVEWYKFFNEHRKKKESKKKKSTSFDLPKISFKIPNNFRQLIVFVKRDLLAKLANTQYLIINFLEAPLLAFILSFIIKYYNESETNEIGYTLLGNSNLPVYIFMSVIAAIFMGLTISAEEIIKDRKILKREAFLNLSWSSYLVSKITVLFILSAIQAAAFVIVGNSIMEIKGLYVHYWIILFSCWVSANIMGLVISDSFKTVVTIYILIPFLVIPQIIISGVIVKYEKLNPTISSPNKIPFYGEIMTARWGYEALAVHQFTENDYMDQFYQYNKMMSISEFKKNYWVKNLENKINFIEKYHMDSSKQEKAEKYLELINNEFNNEMIYTSRFCTFEAFDKLTLESINNKTIADAKDYISKVNKVYIKSYNSANDKRDNIIRSYQKTPEDKEVFMQIKREQHNDRLAEFVENSNEPVRIVEYKGRLIQKIDPIYLDPDSKFLKAHFYAPQKKLISTYYKTFWVNTAVIWLMSLFFYIILYYRGLRRLLDTFENLNQRYIGKERN